MLDLISGIVIGETMVIEDNPSIHQNALLGRTGKTKRDRHPKIRCGAMIEAGASIIGKIEIGERSKVGVGGIVPKDVQAGCKAAGVPAQIVRRHPLTQTLKKKVRVSAEECEGLKGDSVAMN